MLLPLHITIAIISIVISGRGLFRPSRRILYSGYALVAGTLLSGIVLVMTTSTNLAHVCISGLAFIFANSVALYITRRKIMAFARP